MPERPPVPISLPGMEMSAASASRWRERAGALFGFALIALNPPVLDLFNRADSLFGLPVAYLYLFAVWAVLILLSALNSRDLFHPPPADAAAVPEEEGDA